METRGQLVSCVEQTKRPLRVSTSCLLAREGRQAGDRVRDGVEVALEREVDTIRDQQARMRDYLKQVSRNCSLAAKNMPLKYRVFLKP